MSDKLPTSSSQQAILSWADVPCQRTAFLEWLLDCVPSVHCWYGIWRRRIKCQLTSLQMIVSAAIPWWQVTITCKHFRNPSGRDCGSIAYLVEDMDIKLFLFKYCVSGQQPNECENCMHTAASQLEMLTQKSQTNPTTILASVQLWVLGVRLFMLHVASVADAQQCSWWLRP